MTLWKSVKKNYHGQEGPVQLQFLHSSIAIFDSSVVIFSRFSCDFFYVIFVRIQCHGVTSYQGQVCNNAKQTSTAKSRCLCQNIGRVWKLKVQVA